MSAYWIRFPIQGVDFTAPILRKHPENTGIVFLSWLCSPENVEALIIAEGEVGSVEREKR